MVDYEDASYTDDERDFCLYCDQKCGDSILQRGRCRQFIENALKVRSMPYKKSDEFLKIMNMLRTVDIDNESMDQWSKSMEERIQKYFVSIGLYQKQWHVDNEFGHYYTMIYLNKQENVESEIFMLYKFEQIMYQYYYRHNILYAYSCKVAPFKRYVMELFPYTYLFVLNGTICIYVNGNDFQKVFKLFNLNISKGSLKYAISQLKSFVKCETRDLQAVKSRMKLFENMIPEGSEYIE